MAPSTTHKAIAYHVIQLVSQSFERNRLHGAVKQQARSAAMQLSVSLQMTSDGVTRSGAAVRCRQALPRLPNPVQWCSAAALSNNIATGACWRSARACGCTPRPRPVHESAVGGRGLRAAQRRLRRAGRPLARYPS